MRKRIGAVDQEKPVTPVKLKAEATPKGKTAPTPKGKPRATPQKAPRPSEDHEDDQVSDHGPVQVKGEDIPGKAEEKEVAYRKQEPSSSSITVSDNGDEESSKAVSTSEPEYGKAAHQDVKHVFVDLLDANAHIDIEDVHFTWHKDGDVTFNVRAYKPTADAHAHAV